MLPLLRAGGLMPTGGARELGVRLMTAPSLYLLIPGVVIATMALTVAAIGALLLWIGRE